MVLADNRLGRGLQVTKVHLLHFVKPLTQPTCRPLRLARSALATKGQDPIMSSIALVKPLPQDSLGCASEKLLRDESLRGSDFVFYRKSTATDRLSQVETPASQRGYLAGVSLATGHRRRIFHANRASTHMFETGAIYIRDFVDDYKADFYGAFDFVLLELSPALVERTSLELGRPASTSLQPLAGRLDPVLSHLAQAVAPVLASPHAGSRLFIDQVGLAMATYLIGQYDGTHRATAAGAKERLSARTVERAKEVLISHLNGEGSIAEVADACGLSRSHFSRAFHASTGSTPHQWLSMQRLERACSMLRDADMPISQIAHACGFADQSHFTRCFARAFGTTPANWRRTIRH